MRSSLGVAKKNNLCILARVFFVFIFAAAVMTLTCWKINYVAS